MHNQSSTEMRAESKIPKMTQKQTAIDQRAILSICGNSNFSLDTALRAQYAAPQIVVTAAKMTLITNGANACFQQRSIPGADVSEKSTQRQQDRHEAPVSSENVPRSHLVQDEAPAASENLPAAQSAQAEAPAAAENLPAAQGSHLLEVALKEPESQGL